MQTKKNQKGTDIFWFAPAQKARIEHERSLGPYKGKGNKQ